MDVGHVTALLGARFDDTEFEKYDRHLAQVKREAARKEAYKAKLGADFNPAAFRRYESEVRKAERAAKNVKPAQLKGDFDRSGFDKYDRATKDTDRSSGRLVGILGKSGLAFRAVGSGAVAGAAGAAIAAKSIISNATDINESLSKNDVLFGKHAKTVDAFSKTSAASFGISRRAALEATGTFGNLFTALDIGPKKSADMSVSLTKLAADLASFNNASPEEALEAIRSGLVGETEPLRKFGVNLNDAALRTEALRQGLVKNTKEALTPQQKALAVNSLLFKQTEKAQGDFARTSGGLANQQRILKARLSDVGGTIGQKLLPIATKGAKALNDLLSGKGSSGDGLRRAVSRTFDGVKRTVQGAGKFLGQIWDDNRKDLRRLEKAFASLIGPVRAAINRIVLAFRKAFSSDGSLGQDLRSIIKTLVGFITFFYTKIQIPIIRRILPGIVQAFEGFARIIRGVVQLIAGILTLNFGKAWEGVKNIFGGAMKAVWGILRAGTAPLRAAAVAIGGAVASAFSAAWNGIVKTAAGFVNAIIDVLNKIPGVNIGHVSWGGPDTSGIENYRPSGQRHGGQAYREGGKVTMPIAIMGEEAPQHPEWVIPTNPAYRKRAVALWQMAARELGIPGFAIGGVLKDAARGALGPVGDVASGAVSAVKGGWRALAKLLPQIPGGLPGQVLGDAFRAARDKAVAFLKAKVTALIPHVGGGGGARGPAGIGSFDGVPMANWVIGALNYARGRGVSFHPTSGFRSQAHQDAIRASEPRAATVSEHTGTQYPHGAVDFGGFDDPAAYGVKMAVVAATRGYTYPLLAPAGFHDDGHASGTGHRMGGILGLLGGPLGGEPLGRILGFRRGGRHKPKPKPKGPALSAKANRGIRRSVARAGRGIGSFEDSIQTMEREYGQLDRRFGLSDEELLIEHDDGSVTVDERAQTQRLTELAALKAKREAILRKVAEYRRKVAALQKALKRGIAKLKRALKAAKGKARRKERGRYTAQIKAYSDRRAELAPVFRDLGLDLEDQRIDLTELGDEISATRDTRGTPAAPVEATPDIDVGGDAPAPAPEPETVTVGPTVEEIAQAAAEQLGAFNESRAELFATFGQNFNRSAAQAFASATQQAAGARYFGAVPDDQHGVLAGSGGGGVVVTNHFQAPPPDPHAWSQGIGWELRQAI